MRSTLIISAYARYAIIEKSISRKKKVNLKMEMKSSEVGKEVHFDFLFSSLTHTIIQKQYMCYTSRIGK